MKLGVLAAVIAFAAGCGGGDDGGDDTDDTAVDATAAKTCDGSAYEPCAVDADCMIGQVGACRQLNMLGGKFCTQTCDTPCPPVNGMPVECNTMGTACRPPMAATCTPP